MRNDLGNLDSLVDKTIFLLLFKACLTFCKLNDGNKTNQATKMTSIYNIFVHFYTQQFLYISLFYDFFFRLHYKLNAKGSLIYKNVLK